MVNNETDNLKSETLDDREQGLVDFLKADAEIEFVAIVSGKRAIIDVPLDRIHVHNDLKLVRAKSPDIALLKASIKELSMGDSLYPVTLYAEVRDGNVTLWLADGHQRLQAMKDAGAKRTTAQVVLHLRDERDAMELGASSNLARYAMSDDDIFSVIRTGKISDSKLKSITGFNDAKLGRYKLIASNKAVADLVGSKSFGLMRGVSLLEACNKNPDRIAALERELGDLSQQVEKDRGEYLEMQKQGNLPKNQVKKTTGKYWFDLAKDRLDSLKANIEAGVLDQDQLRSAGGKQKAAITGTDAEWKDEIAVYNFFGNKIEKVSPGSFEKILRAIDDGTLRARIEKARQMVVRDTPRLKTDTAAMQQPTKQSPVAAIDNS